jgi:predicted PurR-regulated permease PerM
MEFDIVQWFSENLAMVFGTGVVGTVVVTFVLVLVKKILPDAIASIKSVLVTLVCNVFGITVEGGQNLIESSPMIENLNQITSQSVTQVEIELLRLREKLSGPLYSEVERVAVQLVYEKLYKQYQDVISEEVKNALDAFGTVVRQ